MRQHYLEGVFSPDSVAVVCSEEHVALGERVLQNLLREPFTGSVHVVSRSLHDLAGHDCYRTMAEIGQAVQLAVIAVPAAATPAILRECGEHHVAAAIVLSSGFAEEGERGQILQNQLVEISRSFGMALMGPDCLGIVRPKIKLNASSTRSPVAPGKVALVTQSASFCSAILDWADANGFGFSAVASLGATSHVRIGDVLDYLAQDPETGSILLYVERIANARAFMSGLRAAARLKPVVVIKSGRNEAGRRAALDHARAPLGSDDVFDAAIRRAGAVRVTTVSQLFAAARILASGARTRGPQLAVITNGAGPGVMAADWAGNVGVPLAQPGPETLAALARHFPAHWSHSNPLDLLGDADRERYRAVTEIILRDKNVDGLLVLLTPQAATDPTECARGLIAACRGTRKPVLASWMGQRLVREGRALFDEAGIPHFIAPENGVNAFGFLASYWRNQNTLLQVPESLSEQRDPDVYGAQRIIEHALQEGRSTLSNMEAKAVLRAFRLPVLPSLDVATPADALVAAENVGLPIAMKINSPDILHKTDVGGVRLNIGESRSVQMAFRELVQEVREKNPDARIDGVTIEPMVKRLWARELKIAIGRDPVFGPVISLGAAGIAMELLSESQVSLPPLNDYLGRELISGTQASRILEQVRDIPQADMGRLLEVLQRVSEMACELPRLETLDINPLLVDEEGVVAVAARITVAAPVGPVARYGHMAIHPYPPQLKTRITLVDGTDIVVRPIRPEDAKIEASFVQNLSPQSKYFRFMHGLNRLTPAMLARFTQIDYDREMALVALNPPDEDSMLGVVRYISNPDGTSCEFALTVADAWQSRGVGRQLMEQIIIIAHDRGLETMMGEVLTANSKMLRLCKKLGFHSVRSADDPEITIVSLPL